MTLDRGAVAVSAALFLGTLLVFSRASGNDFVNYDDPVYLTENHPVQAGLMLKGIRSALTTCEAANWHPLTWISHMVDWSAFEDHPPEHHPVSLVWHALNTANRLPTLTLVSYGRLKLLPWWDPLRAAIRASRKSSPRSHRKNDLSVLCA